jgi:isopenicillin-N epimerase
MAQKNLKEYFLLDPEIIFLNHGSFGATPKPVMETYHDWQQRLEGNPVKFLDRDIKFYFKNAREALGRYFNADPDHLVYIPNVTYAVNVIASSLRLGPKDEILATDHEYGACNKTWLYHCHQSGSKYIQQPIPLPIGSQEDILECVWSGVTSQTKLIFLSHITSPTALTFPVKAICKRARENGILTMVDGAHAPGHIPVDLMDINPDFYSGNCHKWLMAPKGSAFFYAHPDVQHLIKPLVISWGWHADQYFTTGSTFLDNLQWLGTKDPSAYFSVPAAIEFQKENDWRNVQKHCYALARQAIDRINKLTGALSPYPEAERFQQQMASALLPKNVDSRSFQARLYNEYHIEIPCLDWGDQKLIRISVQGYNNQEDIDVFLDAMEDIIPEYQNDGKL